MCKDHWYQTVRLPFYCHFLKWVVKSLRTSSGGSKTSSTTVWRWGRSADSQGGTGRPSLTRLSASAHQSNLFCFLLRVLRVYGLLGLSWRDFNASSECSPSPACLAQAPLYHWQHLRYRAVTNSATGSWLQMSQHKAQQWALLKSMF